MLAKFPSISRQSFRLSNDHRLLFHSKKSNHENYNLPARRGSYSTLDELFDAPHYHEEWIGGGVQIHIQATAERCREKFSMMVNFFSKNNAP